MGKKQWMTHKKKGMTHKKKQTKTKLNYFKANTKCVQKFHLETRNKGWIL